MTVVVIAVAMLMFVLISLVIKWYNRPVSGMALVRTGSGGIMVAFDKGIFVIPILHNLEKMDITIKSLTIERKGDFALLCKDNVRVEAKITFFVKVNKDVYDVEKVAFSVGCEKASKKETLESLFNPKFTEALKTIAHYYTYEELYNNKEKFRDEILTFIGRDLNGYVLEDCSIEYLEKSLIKAKEEFGVCIHSANCEKYEC